MAFYGVGNLAQGGWNAGQTALAHGGVGGVSNMAMGGSFKDGFLSGGFTSLASPVIGTVPGGRTAQVVAAAVVGGTAAELGGGKFANGAATGAFSYLYNAAAHEGDARSRIAEVAESYLGDASYGYDAAHGNFPENSWKCNLFVHDILIDAGVPAPMMSGGEWPLQANSWANPNYKIPGWELVVNPLPGDVAAIPRAGGSGHVGIYMGDKWGADIIAANRNGVGWSRSHFYNDYARSLAGASGPAVYRRYVGQ